MTVRDGGGGQELRDVTLGRFLRAKQSIKLDPN